MLVNWAKGLWKHALSQLKAESIRYPELPAIAEATGLLVICLLNERKSLGALLFGMACTLIQFAHGHTERYQRGILYVSDET